MKKKFLNESILPDWWSDDIAEDPSGFHEGSAIIASRLGFKIKHLLREGTELEIPSPNGVKFKKSGKHSSEDVALTTEIACRVARVAASAFADVEVFEELPDPGRWREELLKASDKEWVCLRHLIDATWKLGIPVIHLSEFPRDAKKADALTTIVNGRPVIVILNQRKSPSWMAFILAHELGHIFHEHLKNGETLVDGKIGQQSEEKHEAEANEFAAELLTGHENVGLLTTRVMSPQLLANKAKNFGERYKIAPGVVTFQWAFVSGKWAMAYSAIKILEKGDEAAEDFRNAVSNYIKKDSLSSDQWEWLSQLSM